MNMKKKKLTMLMGSVISQKIKPLKLLFSTLAGGLGMWIIAGLWHNLILPRFDNNVEAHHDGLILMLVAYFILSFLMSYLYVISNRGGNPVIDGLTIGVIVGILWVFPHGLALAGAQNTSIIYEIKNSLYHIIEQGIGGIIIAIIYGKNMTKNI